MDTPAKSPAGSVRAASRSVKAGGSRSGAEVEPADAEGGHGRFPGTKRLVCDPLGNVRQSSTALEPSLQVEGQRLEWTARGAVEQHVRPIGQQEVIETQRPPLDHVNELVEVDVLERKQLVHEVQVPEGDTCQRHPRHGLELRQPKGGHRRERHPPHHRHSRGPEERRGEAGGEPRVSELAHRGGTTLVQGQKIVDPLARRRQRRPQPCETFAHPLHPARAGGVQQVTAQPNEAGEQTACPRPGMSAETRVQVLRHQDRVGWRLGWSRMGGWTTRDSHCGGV